MQEGHKYNILYVDDEESNLRIFQTAFKRLYNVTIASSAEDAVPLLKEKEFHLIITDQKMPKVTGVEFLAQILDEHPEPVRMVLTGFSDVSAIIDAINTGKVYKYITKPWSKQALKDIIDEGLSEYEKERQKKEQLLTLQKELEEQKRLIEQLKSQLVP